MAGLPPVALITAALDLQLVRLLRQAIQTADISSRPACGSSAINPLPRIQPTPGLEPRPVITPTPRFEPRLVIRPAVKVEPDIAVLPPAEPETSRIAAGPIEPPWKVLPWEKPAPPAPPVKFLIPKPDLPIKGSVLDLFC